MFHTQQGGGNVGWQIMSKLSKRVKDLSELKRHPIIIKENTKVDGQQVLLPPPPLLLLMMMSSQGPSLVTQDYLSVLLVELRMSLA